MRRTGQAVPHKRDGTYYLVRRVPKEFEHLDPRGIVRISTNIAIVDDPRAVRAKTVVAQLALELEAYWRGLRDGQSAEARIRYNAAQNRRFNSAVMTWVFSSDVQKRIDGVDQHGTSVTVDSDW